MNRTKLKNMKNIIKNVLFLFVAISILSCSEDENTTSTDESFFNLNVGNKWVYKKYENSNFNPTEFTFNGVVDTIKIIDEVTISGLTFAKKLTKRVNINSNAIVYEKITYVRVNNQGHLVEINEDTAQNTVQESFGFVLHPGSDFNYIYVVDEPYGTIEHRLYEQTTMNVEGNDYTIMPYKGVFTPAATQPELISKTIEYNYQKNIGLVKFVCHAVSSNYTWEERLVYYEIED